MSRLLLFTLAVAATAADPVPFTRDQQEQFLLKARIVERKPVNRGVASTQQALLDDGQFKHYAHIATINVSKPEFEGSRGKELNFTDKYIYNVAAYELAKLLGVGMVPPSVERKVAGQGAAFSWWVDDILMAEIDRVKKKAQAPDPEDWNKQMYIVRVFDQLIYNTDRTLENLLIARDWKIWMIDHSRAFRMQKTLQNPANLVQCDRKLLARLRELKKSDVAEKLKPGLSGMQIDGLMARRDLIVKFFDGEIQKKGEAAVLYDLL